MTVVTNEALRHTILSMDAYNRGIVAGIIGLDQPV